MFVERFYIFLYWDTKDGFGHIPQCFCEFENDFGWDALVYGGAVDFFMFGNELMCLTSEDGERLYLCLFPYGEGEGIFGDVSFLIFEYEFVLIDKEIDDVGLYFGMVVGYEGVELLA